MSVGSKQGGSWAFAGRVGERTLIAAGADDVAQVGERCAETRLARDLGLQR